MISRIQHVAIKVAEPTKPTITFYLVQNLSSLPKLIMDIGFIIIIRILQILFGVIRKFLLKRWVLTIVLGVAAGGTTHIHESGLNFLVFVVCNLIVSFLNIGSMGFVVSDYHSHLIVWEILYIPRRYLYSPSKVVLKIVVLEIMSLLFLIIGCINLGVNH